MEKCQDPMNTQEEFLILYSQAKIENKDRKGGRTDGNGFPLSRQAFHARRLHLLHGGAGHRAAAVRERAKH